LSSSGVLNWRGTSFELSQPEGHLLQHHAASDTVRSVQSLIASSTGCSQLSAMHPRPGW